MRARSKLRPRLTAVQLLDAIRNDKDRLVRRWAARLCLGSELARRGADKGKCSSFTTTPRQAVAAGPGCRGGKVL